MGSLLDTKHHTTPGLHFNHTTLPSNTNDGPLQGPLPSLRHPLPRGTLLTRHRLLSSDPHRILVSLRVHDYCFTISRSDSRRCSAPIRRLGRWGYREPQCQVFFAADIDGDSTRVKGALPHRMDGVNAYEGAEGEANCD